MTHKYRSKKDFIDKTIVYDNGGETFDRYTVFTPDGYVYGMSENASGFNQWLGDDYDVEKGSHLGKKLKGVPKGIKWAIGDRFEQDRDYHEGIIGKAQSLLEDVFKGFGGK